MNQQDYYRSIWAGMDMFEYLTRSRRCRAQELIRIRRELRENGMFDVHKSNHIARRVAPVAGDIRSTRDAQRFALNRIEWAEEPIPRGLPCGADDAYGERQDMARSMGLAIIRQLGRPIP